MELHAPTNTFGGEASTRKCRQKVGVWMTLDLVGLLNLHRNLSSCMQLMALFRFSFGDFFTATQGLAEEYDSECKF